MGCAYKKGNYLKIQSCLMVLGVAYAIIILSLSIVAYISYDDTLDFIGVIENWAYSPIIDIEIKPATEKCSGSDKDEYNDRQFFRSNNLLAFEWMGFKSGCDCSSNTVRDVKEGECSADKINTCQNIQETQGAWFTGLRDSSNQNYKVCLKRAMEVNYFNAYVKSNGECRQGLTKSCGSGEAQFCLPPSYTKCPIVSIKFGAVDVLHLETVGTGSSQISIRRQTDLLNNLNPLSEFTLTQGPGVCRNIYSLNYNPNFEPYILIKNEYKQCSASEVDGSWGEVASSALSTENLFAANGINTVNSANYPGLFLDGGAESYKLYQRGYVKWTLKCREDDQFEEFGEKVLLFLNMVNTQIAIIVLSSLLLSLFFFGLIFSIIDVCYKQDSCICCCRVRCCHCVRRCWGKKSSEKRCSDYFTLYDPLTVILFFFKWGIELAILISSIVIVVNAKEVNTTIEYFRPLQCTDDFTQKSLDKFGDAIKEDIPISNEVITGLTASAMAVQFILQLIFWRGLTKKKRKAFKAYLQAHKITQLNSDHSIPDWENTSFDKGENNQQNQGIELGNQNNVQKYIQPQQQFQQPFQIQQQPQQPLNQFQQQQPLQFQPQQQQPQFGYQPQFQQQPIQNNLPQPYFQPYPQQQPMQQYQQQPQQFQQQGQQIQFQQGQAFNAQYQPYPQIQNQQPSNLL